MGLNKTAGGNAKFIRIKDGKLYVGKDEVGYDEIEGIITDIYLKDEEFENRPQTKLYVVLEDESERYILNVGFESSYSTSLIGFLKNADLKQSLTLVPILKKETKDGKEVENRRILVKQNGSFLKAFYTKDNPNGLPAMVKNVRRGGKIGWDKTDMMDFYAEVVEKELKSAVSGNKPTVFRHDDAPLSAAASKYQTAVDVENEVAEDDLPF